MRFVQILIIFLVVNMTTEAQEVSLTANAKKVVEVGERFQITYQVNAEAGQFQGPKFNGFRYLGGPSSFSSFSTQIINNKVTQSVTLTYTYQLQASKEGVFEISPARVVVKGKQIKSNELTIKVVPSGGKPKTSPQSRAQNSNIANSNAGSQRQPSTGLTDDDLYIKAIVDKTNPYLGEQVIVTYKIYTRVPVTPQSISQYPSFPGFWSKNLMGENEISPTQSEMINGQEYVTAEIRKAALFPQKPGELEIEPMELSCVAQLKRQTKRKRSNDPFDLFFDDPFFNRGLQNVELVLTSNPIKINVKPLPATNKPATFSGAVGQFRIKSKVDKTKLVTNDALTYSLTVSGKGNLELIGQFDVSFPPDFEIYDPKIINNITTSANGIAGSRTFEYLIIPRNAGDFTIGPVTFTYFDAGSKQYRSEYTPTYEIKVEKGQGGHTEIGYSGVSQEDVKYIGSDIRHIYNGPMHLAPIQAYFFNTIPFYLLVTLPLLIIISLIVILKSRQHRRQNLVLMMNKKATRVARKNLKKASKFLKSENKDEFFIEISQALWGYLSNKFNIPRAKLSMDTVNEELDNQGIHTDTIEQFIETLKNTEFARFAPGDSSVRMHEVYDEALDIISKIERELR